MESTHLEAQGAGEELSVEEGDSFATPEQGFGEEDKQVVQEDDVRAGTDTFTNFSERMLKFIHVCMVMFTEWTPNKNTCFSKSAPFQVIFSSYSTIFDLQTMVYSKMYF